MDLSFPPLFFSLLVSRNIASHLSQEKEELRDKKGYLVPKIYGVMEDISNNLHFQEQGKKEQTKTLTKKK